MASLELALFVMVALAYVANSQCDVFENVVENVKEQIGIPTEKTGLFDTFKGKADNFYHSAVKKGKEAYQATKEAVSKGFDKVKEKYNEFMEKNY